MKRLLLIMGATFLLVAPSYAQGQTARAQSDITVSEFRQVLLDLGSYLDAHKGTDLRRQLEAITDDGLKQIYAVVPSPRQLQSAVAALKDHDTAQRLNASANIARLRPLAAFPACTPNSIIDNSTGAVCTPAYPDSTNGSWQAMVNPLITFGAFSPTGYADVSSQACGLTVEVNLQQVTVALQSAVNAITPGCSIIPAPLNAACFGPLIAIAAADSVSAGLFSDCIEQDGLVNAAEIDAGFHNTVTVYNALQGVDTHLTNVDTHITAEFSALDTHLTNVDNHVAAEFVALAAQVSALAAQLTAATNQLVDQQKQIMKLQLTPDGLKQIDPAILTCNGGSSPCPNVLTLCPNGKCSWNNVGPLP